MKSILRIVEEYLRKHPSPSAIAAYQHVLKLTYTYSSPFTDSKLSKDVLYPIAPTQTNHSLNKVSKTLIFNEKGRIEESDSFQSILTKEKHQKVFQDDVFGSAKLSQDQRKWVYIAEKKPEVLKSLFNGGKGKLPYKHDFGETYDDVRQVSIYIWDKSHKEIYATDIESSLIPSFPSFLNVDGSEIIFHAYVRKAFGHGLLHCFNREVKIYSARMTKKNDIKQEAKKENWQWPLKLLIKDKNETNIFPSVSPCFNYLIYLSGTGITHTYYLDLVIMRKNADGQWHETHRIENKFIGFYCTLKTYVAVREGKAMGYVQTLDNGQQLIYEIELETGTMRKMVEPTAGQSYSISEVLACGSILGKLTDLNFNTFFYTNAGKLQVVEPLQREEFTLKEIHHPVHSFLLQSSEIDLEYTHRAALKPLLVILHGGPHGSTDPSLTLLKFALLKMGYAILLPNFSGSVGYGPQKVSAALKKIGEIDGEQVVEAVKHVLKENKHLDASRVHVYGGSYGGYLSAIMAGRFSEYFRSAIILNGVLSIQANLWFSDIPEWSTVEANGTDKLSTLTAEHYQEMHRQSPISQPMKIPILQILGGKDRRVPYRQGLLFDGINKQQGNPITTYVFENSAHSLADSVETSLDVIMKILRFLQDVKDQDKVE